MKRDEMFSIVCELLRDSPEMEQVEIIDETDPFSELDKDSHDGIVFACLLSERLGVDLNPDLNPLVDDEHLRPRKVGEIVDWCLDRLQEKAKK